jgi:PAS domain-containing protein
MWDSLIIGLGISATAIFAAFGSLVLLTVLRLRLAPVKTTMFIDQPDRTILLFDGTDLVDSTPSARKLLSLRSGRGDAWAQLMLFLAPRFPDIAAQMDRVSDLGLLTLSDDGLDAQKPERSPLNLRAEMAGGLMRITLTDPERDLVTPGQDGMVLSAMTRDLSDLNAILTRAPMLMWREDPTGTITWANAPYILHVERELPLYEGLRWPLPKLFDPVVQNARGNGNRKRLKTRTEDGFLWFDLIEAAVGAEKLVYAMPVDSAVTADYALKDFQQTLTKTFAQLATGLAIFDQHRRLQLFNPALMDLTSLPIDVLTERPSLHAFLDALHDQNMIPEPKNYRTWRDRIIEIELAAEAGSFEETWVLPGGQTYRITGRPYPNQALALMFEDISTEIMQTRRYKAELARSDAVLDVMEDAVILFAPDGRLAKTNAAYDRLWDHDAVVIMKSGGLGALLMDWQDIAVPSAGWAKIRDYVGHGGAPNPCSGEVRMNDGRSVGFRCVTMQDRSCLVIFRVLTLSLPFEVLPSRPILKTA